MDSSHNVVNKLRELDNILKNVSEAEMKWAAYKVRSEAKAERNVLQCPRDSLEAMRKLRLEMKDLSKHSMSTQSKLQLMGHSSQKMLNMSTKILQYLEAETAKTEDHLQSYGYTPLHDCSRIKPGESGTSFHFPEDSAKVNPIMTTTEDSQGKSDTRPIREVDVKESSEISTITSPVTEDLVVKQRDGEHFFSMPKSPEAPSIDEKFGRVSLHSPEDPLIGSSKEKYEPCRNIKNEFAALPDSPVLDVDICEESKNLNKQKFFNTPGVSSKLNMIGGNMPYFDAIVRSPISPNVDELSGPKSVEFKLHSNKSALAQAPHQTSQNYDDDTIYMLGGGSKRFTHTRHNCLPDSPDFTTFGIPKMQDPLDDKLPDTPQSPDLTEYIKETKENIEPSRYCSYQIKQADYDELPFYLKRVLPFNIVNDSLAKVMGALVALPGEAQRTATTEKLISDVTNLGGKTKLFASLLQSLNIAQRQHRNNTEYLEVII